MTAKHDPEIVAKFPPYHFHNKSWSARFVCGHCGLEKRYNTNYLGGKVLVCNGVKFTPTKRETAKHTQQEAEGC